MGEGHIEVVRIGEVTKHPNADTLSMTTVGAGYPVIFRTGEFKAGDLAVYVPVDSIVPDTEEWQWLAPAGAALRPKDRRIRAKRLRGVFSMGLLTKAPEGAVEGQDVAAQMGITRYDPDAASEVAPPRPKRPRPKGLLKTLRWLVMMVWLWLAPWRDPSRPVRPPKLRFTPGVYDIEPYRKYGRTWFEEGERVVLTEKIHGQNASFVHDGKQLHLKSRTRWRKFDPEEASNAWAIVAKKYQLASKLAAKPGIILFGETYGNNSDMPYSAGPGTDQEFAAFDAYDSNTGKWLDHDDFVSLCAQLEIPTAPELLRIDWSNEESFEALLPFAEGKTTLADGGHIREGFVIKPVVERTINGGQRVQLKMVGEQYHLRKEA